MSYTAPTLNLAFQAKANYNWAGVGAPVAPFILINTPCNLAYGWRTHLISDISGGSMFLLFGPGVALRGRDQYAVANGDAVEVPMGSGRWYTVANVDRAGAGFPNEHQVAILLHPKPFYPTTTYLFPAP